MSLSHGQSNYSPVYKGKGSKLDIENYRPRSLINFYCKIIETLLCDKSGDYIDANKLSSSYQYGFRSHRSILSQLQLLVKNKFIECINNRPCGDGIYTDMSKAFDSLVYRIKYFK